MRVPNFNDEACNSCKNVIKNNSGMVHICRGKEKNDSFYVRRAHVNEIL